MHVHSGLALRKGLFFEFYADENLPKKLFTDSARLNQVLINLISNAIKFTTCGHVKVAIGY